MVGSKGGCYEKYVVGSVVDWVPLYTAVPSHNPKCGESQKMKITALKNQSERVKTTFLSTLRGKSINHFSQWKDDVSSNLFFNRM